MQGDCLSIPRTPSLRDHGVALRPPPWGSWERWAVQVRVVGTGQDERDSGLGLYLVPSLSGPLSLLTSTAARTRRDALGGRWGNFACRACGVAPVQGVYYYAPVQGVYHYA